jgi:hypothetical protein
MACTKRKFFASGPIKRWFDTACRLRPEDPAEFVWGADQHRALFWGADFHAAAICELSFKPTASQIETIAELQTAKMPLAVIAARLGVDQATFKAWTARLAACRGYVDPPQSSAEILREIFPDRAQRENEPRVVAARMFEGD